MVWNSNRSSVKCISFKLSRVRFVTEPEVQQKELVVTGSWMEERNRISLWQYGVGSSIDNRKIKPVSESEDGLSAGVLGDSADDPRLLSSIVHIGSVQDLKVHHPTKRIFTASSEGTLQVLEANETAPYLHRITDPDWMPFGQQFASANSPIAMSSLALSMDGDKVFAGNDFGQLAVIQIDRIPLFQDPNKSVSSVAKNQDAILMSGSDIATANAIERVDNNCLATVNQLGQLKLWDLRCGLTDPQRRLLRPEETQPLLCLCHHPGQSHLLAVGGVGGSSAAAYIWDLRAEQYPLTEVACDGRSVWEVAFHPRQPKNLYLATETAGLLRISCRGDTDSWTGFKGSRRKLTVSSALPDGPTVVNVISFDLSNTQLICGHSDAILQTVPCDVNVY